MHLKYPIMLTLVLLRLVAIPGALVFSLEGGVPIFQFYRNWITIHIFCFLDDMVVPNLAADEACRFMFMLGCGTVNVTVWPTINPLAIRQVYLSELRI